MNIQKSIFPWLLVGAALVLAPWRFARSTRAKPAPRRGTYSEDTKRFTEIDAYIEQQMRRLSIPGASLAIVEGDRIVHLRGFGRARPGGEAPTPQTPFLIGSLTKSITALGVMQLVEAGKVELDAPVQRYLPWFILADPQAAAQTPALPGTHTRGRCAPERSAGASVTVRHLLNQTSGLRMSAGMNTPLVFDDLPDALERYVRTALSTLALAHPAGQVCEYCNLNYDLLGLVIEAASGERYADYVQEHIFDPLEMHHSYTSQMEARRNGLAVGHRYWFSVPIPAPHLPVPSGSVPSGNIFSCVEDMARYMIAHLNGGYCGGGQILSEEGMQLLHLGAVDYSMFGIKSGRYAMGWFDMDKNHARLVTHGGNNPDFSAYAGFLPEQKKGLVLLINSDHFGLPPILGEVGFGAMALLDNRQPEPVRLGFIPWMMRLLALIPLLQVVDAAATLRRTRQWQRDPALRPSRERIGWQHLLLPLIPNLSLAAIPLFLRARGTLGYLRFFMPDIYWTALVSGGFAGFWAIFRTWLIARTVRKP